MTSWPAINNTNVTPSCTSSPEWNRRPRMSFFRSPKMLEVTRGKIWAVRRMLECFPAKSLNLILHQITCVIIQMIILSDSIPGRFDLMARRSTLSHHVSALLCLPLFPVLDEYTLHYAHLQSNKETTVWTCAFSLCISPTLQMAVSKRNNSVASFARKVFYDGCSDFIWLPFIQILD